MFDQPTHEMLVVDQAAGTSRSPTRPVARSISAIGAVLALALTASVTALVGILPAAASADDCPNAALRQGLSAGLGDCRAFEMVSPVDKNGGDVTGQQTPVQAAVDGNAVAYRARASFGDTLGSGPIGQTQYVARRGPSGWSSLGVTPTPNLGALTGLFGDTAVVNFSADLRRVVVWGIDLPAVTGDVPEVYNLYSEDTLTRELRLVSTPPPDPFNLITFYRDFNPGTNALGMGGVSQDSRHIAFAAVSRLIAEAPVGVPSVYEWDDGTLRIASILPDGTVAPDGAVLAPVDPAVPPQVAYRGTVSPDGSRVLFTSPPTGQGQLYARVDHSRTAWISQPETSGPAPAPENVSLQQVTGDSRHVVFATTSRLLDEDTNDGADLYLYTDSANPETDSNLTLVTDTGDITAFDGEGTAVIGSSDDASRIYFYAAGKIWLWEDGEVRVVASSGRGPDGSQFHYSATASSPGGARVTPDGRYLAFRDVHGSVQRGTATPVIGESDPERAQIFLYDLERDELRCVSCPPTGVATERGALTATVTNMTPDAAPPGMRPSFLLADGRVFFSTAQALVSQDVNGVTDAYGFDPGGGRVSLLSTGKGSDPASFVDASASGDDVFIVTRQSLVKADRDRFVDLYDARVGGGFPDAPDPPAPCAGDGCQGAPGSTPEAGGGIGSLGYRGGEPVRGRSAGLRVARLRGRGVLAVRLPSAGRLTWAGRGVRAGTRRFARAGRYRLRFSLAPEARRRLERRGRYGARLRLTFVGPAGARSRTSTSLTFTSSKKGR